jgi:hypothetical protein
MTRPDPASGAPFLSLGVGEPGPPENLTTALAAGPLTFGFIRSRRDFNSLAPQDGNRFTRPQNTGGPHCPGS